MFIYKSEKQDIFMLERGKFGVIEGNDGTGKTVQTQRLVERLISEGFDVSVYDFPQYGKNAFAQIVTDYLSGKFGDPTQLDPYLASMLYAPDRWKVAESIRRNLDEGKIVVANRFTSANMGHQGGKFRMKLKKVAWGEKSLKELAAEPEWKVCQEEKYREEKVKILSEQEKFYSWLREMEFDSERGFGIPYPDLTVILNLDPRIAHRLKGEQKSETGTQRDGHESNLEYLECVSETFRELAGREKGWRLVECGDRREGILKPEVIHEEIWGFFKGMIAA